MKTRSKLVLGAATGGFIGYIPVAPGTFGSGAGLLIYFLMSRFHFTFVLPGLILLIAFAVWVSGEAEIILRARDPKCIVIDEVVGMAVTLFGFSFSLRLMLAGFILFRFFDILKPFPIGFLEKKLPGGAGVVADDVAAGVISNVVLHALLFAGIMPGKSF